MNVQNPHDRFFRQSFGRVEIARDYLEEYLPAELRRLLDLEQLQLQDGSFIDEEMQAHQSDLLYQSRLASGQPVAIYFLFEHKSYSDPLVTLQLLRYMLRFWERQVKEKAPLSPVIPLVIYHGEKKWQVATNFAALFDIPEEVRPYIPEFRFLLGNFSHLSDEEIRGNIWLQVNLEVFRAIFNPYLREELPGLISLIFKLSTQRTGVEYIRTILYYLTEATQKVTREDLRAALLAQGADGERIMKTIAQEFIQEGIEKGLEQGRLEAKREIERIARILLKQHDAVTVSEITGLSLEEVQALQEE